MTPQRQLHVDAKNGDCFRAAMCSVLDIPMSDDLPNVDDEGCWFFKWNRIVERIGLAVEYDEKRIWRRGYWIASVPSKNLAGCTHAIVMKGHQVAHDPSTKRRYRRGQSMLGGDKVLGGYYFVVEDPALLHRQGEPGWWAVPA